VGTNKANPLAAIVSSVLMLEHLGETEAAQRIRSAVADFDGDTTALGTTGITQEILRRI
jgi:isocitrate/isopropylmalate dehydrogenase